ncbi:MAG: DUF389 domain-containing protein [Lachnospiraceae bacterium]|nr:DUF389 domain-containing protein [Lachnospiraceae bacterium]
MRDMDSTNNFWNKVKAYSEEYFTFNGFLIPQNEAEEAIRDEVSFRGTNLVILVLAIFIASLGLNTNSTAVIIGAMLISPLMGPIIGIGLGIGITDFDLLKRSARNLVIAAAFSMLTSTIYFLISPVSEGHSELLARTTPTIYDVLIGFFGGGAGIVAICSRSKGNVIPGVAIATALMPPLCTAGYGLATLQMHYFLGATYLFLINSIFIGLATFLGVKLFKFKPVATTDPVRAKRIRRLVYTIAILTLIPSIYLTYTMLRQSRFEIDASQFINGECQWPDTHVLSSDVKWTKGEREIDLTLIGKVLPQDSLQLALSSQLRFYGLAGTHLKIIQGNSQFAPDAMSGSSLKDIYQISQATIQEKQNKIDSLDHLLKEYRKELSGAATVSPELKVVFPWIRDIAVTRSVVANPQAEKNDTVNLALVSTQNHRITAAEETKLTEYLKARLKLTQLKTVNIPSTIN